MNKTFSEWFENYKPGQTLDWICIRDLMLDAWIAGSQSNVDKCEECGRRIVYDGISWKHASQKTYHRVHSKAD